VGLAASGIAAASLLLSGEVGYPQSLAFFALGSLGSMLPDIDSDSSSPLRAGFAIISLCAAFLLMFSLARWFHSLAELLLIWLAGYLVVRGLIFALFNRLTTHRGIFHSVPAAVCFTFITVLFADRIWNLPPGTAWTAGLFVGSGYLVHLLLDEIYSVNLFGVQTRRSFGTALKFWYRKNIASTAYMYLVTIALGLFLPSPKPVWETLVQQQFNPRFFPSDGWFRAPRAFISDQDPLPHSSIEIHLPTPQK